MARQLRSGKNLYDALNATGFRSALLAAFSIFATIVAVVQIPDAGLYPALICAVASAATLAWVYVEITEATHGSSNTDDSTKP